LSGIKLGQTAKVRIDGSKETFTGAVTYISSVAEFSPKNVQTADERAKLVFRVKITLQNQAGIFKPGMPADAWMATGK
jgi:HlyD family secretion protein